MAVKTETLEKPERGMNLTTRETADIERLKGSPTAEDELQALRDRVARVKALEPVDQKPIHCHDCFSRGWLAAVQAVEAKE